MIQMLTLNSLFLHMTQRASEKVTFYFLLDGPAAKSRNYADVVQFTYKGD